MFCYFVNRFPFHFLKSLGFGNFWINAFLWLPVKLAMLELKIRYGSLENYFEHCNAQRNQRNEPAA